LIYRIQPVSSRKDQARAVAVLREYMAQMVSVFDTSNLASEIAAFPTYWTLPRSELLLLNSPISPVGCIGWAEQPDGAAEIRRFYLRSTVRGRGLGRFMLESLLLRLADYGFRRCVLHTSREMEAATGLYRATGFRPTSPYGGFREEEFLFFERSIGSGKNMSRIRTGGVLTC